MSTKKTVPKPRTTPPLPKASKRLPDPSPMSEVGAEDESAADARRSRDKPPPPHKPHR